jgi:hypothetical protein
VYPAAINQQLHNQECRVLSIITGMKASAINHQQAIGHDASQYLASAL